MPDWIAAFVQDQVTTLWELSGDSVKIHNLTDRSAFQTYARSVQAPIIACGLDIQTRKVPCAPIESMGVSDISANIAAVSGLAQSQPAALSRGSETAVAGFLQTNPQYDGVLCVLNDETLWAQISAGEVVSFQTYLTPELRIALSGGSEITDGFDIALSDSLSRPDHLARHLSSAKATFAMNRITGHLIGAELAAAKPYWLGQRIVLLGQNTSLYSHALSAQGVPVESASLLDMTLAGLRLAYSKAMKAPIGQAN